MFLFLPTSDCKEIWWGKFYMNNSVRDLKSLVKVSTPKKLDQLFKSEIEKKKQQKDYSL